jgi:uncharacterized protein YndB with AHSA1/START domain
LVGTCEVRYTRHYQASPDEVWAALTEPTSLARWLAPAREIDLREGGPFELELNEHRTMKGRIRAAEPSRLLELDWADGEEPSIVRFQLSANDGGTTLVLDHRRIEARVGMQYIARWQHHLDRLEAVVAP